MNGAIFYASRYGSTAEYAELIGEATGLQVFDVNNSDANPQDYDYLVLGSPILYFKLLIKVWLHRHAKRIASKPIILFSVSGAGEGPKLDSWISKSLPEVLRGKVTHISLRGRQRPADLNWVDFLMLKIAGLMNPDRKIAKDELSGFDYFDPASIAPVVAQIESQRRKPSDQFSIAAAMI